MCLGRGTLCQTSMLIITMQFNTTCAVKEMQCRPVSICRISWQQSGGSGLFLPPEGKVFSPTINTQDFFKPKPLWLYMNWYTNAVTSSSNAVTKYGCFKKISRVLAIHNIEMRIQRSRDANLETRVCLNYPNNSSVHSIYLGTIWEDTACILN